MKSLEILVPEQELKKVLTLLKEFGVVVKKSNAQKLKKIFQKRALSDIGNPLEWQKKVRQEWER